MKFDFSFPSKVCFGRGEIERVGKILVQLGVKKALLVHGKSVKKARLCDIVQGMIEAEDIEVKSFSDVEPNPTDKTIEKGAEFAKENGIDAIVAIGGGSAMDCAKGINILQTNPRPIGLYEGGDKVKHRGLPLICIPTTAGTSSEITPVSIVTDTAKDRKYVVAGKNVGPDYAIVDPNMLDNISSKLMAETGMDALTHGIESYVSRFSSPLTKALSIEAIKIIYNNLQKACNSEDYLEAREQMALACVIVGGAFSNAGLGLAHAISHTISAHYNISHGIACGVVLPSVIDFNYLSAKSDYDRILMEIEPESDKPLSMVISDFEKKINIPKLNECNISLENLQFLAEETMNEDYFTNPNQNVSVEGVHNILVKAYQRK